MGNLLPPTGAQIEGQDMSADIQLREGENIDRSLYRILREAGTWMQRDNIMRCAGFLSPKDHPVSAYVEFQCAVMRVNRLIRPWRMRIRKSPTGSEIYRLEAMQ